MEHAPPSPRRHAAGTDPQKRAAILKGAAQIFMDKGFDGAGVSDICRAAGVSKSTLYVYFASKEDLFETLVSQERDRLFVGVEAQMDGDAPLPDRLTAFATALAHVLCSDTVIRAQRTVIGIAERMPDLGTRFYEGGALRAQRTLALRLDKEVAAGRLAIDDTTFAACQLIELSTVGLWRQRLFGHMQTPPHPARVAASAAAAVEMFLSRYGT
ncbi:TetR/AcrR family transcriptional regulator [Loktanella sp. M215]|uniref:TetR/AcrR family transcriptional regulator n=1 Tax=Loktanella sp. M215 TaxID=2675431 RepID=UPI001F489E81|nr:TetR/AcrR family transcriptional regulator [Loktanella sp. M215]MCF7701254.1 TetR family transcriptional regulator [Loktanella sp. M215]